LVELPAAYRLLWHNEPGDGGEWDREWSGDADTLIGTRFPTGYRGRRRLYVFHWEAIHDDHTHLRWQVGAMRYQHDRIRIICYEYEVMGHAARLRAWLVDRWGDAVVVVDEATEDSPFDAAEMVAAITDGFEAAPEPREAILLSATLANYLIDRHAKTQIWACDAAQVAIKTWRKYKERGALYSPQEYRQRGGCTLAEAAAPLLGK
jgi:hypothetical protein